MAEQQDRGTLLADHEKPRAAETAGARQRRVQLPCISDLTTRLFTLAEAWAIQADPVRDQRYRLTTIGPLVVEYLNWYRLRRPSARTVDTKERILARLCVALPPGVTVADVDVPELSLYLNTVPPDSWPLHRSIINGFIEWAIEFDHRSAKNPVKRLGKLISATQQPVYKIFTEAEQQALVNASRFMDSPPHDRARARLLLDSGMRKGEARMLRVGDVDPIGRCVTVTGKGGKPRLIPIRGEFWADWAIFLIAPIPKLGFPVELHHHVWFPMRVAGEYMGRERQVTASYPDRPMVDSGFHGWWVRLCGFAGLGGPGDHEYRKLHMTRHTYATDALDASEGDLYGVSEMLGHASTKVTEVYLHSSKRRMESVADKLSRARSDDESVA